jgi:dTMP kinase
VSGLFVAFEGIDGCGKSTQARHVAALLDARLTFEPGDTPLGVFLREQLLDRATPMTPSTEALLMLADRSHHVAQLIAPTLASGVSVVSDRYWASSIAYQGFGRGLDVDDLLRATHLAIGDCQPDLTFLIDLPVDEAFRRRPPRADDRFESADRAFHERVRAGYLTLAADQPTWAVIDGTGTVAEVTARVEAVLRDRQLS